MPRVLRAAVVALSLLVPVLASAPAAGAAVDPRYALVHGCYALQSPATGKFVTKTSSGYAATAADAASGEAFRMQATRLGAYMLYGRAKDYLGLQDGAVKPISTPGPAADFTVADASGAGRFTLVSQGGQAVATGADGTLAPADGATPFTFVKAAGCPDYPEAEIDATGPVYKGPGPYAATRGFIDAHMHMMGFGFL